jgi:hypothetical protein
VYLELERVVPECNAGLVLARVRIRRPSVHVPATDNYLVRAWKRKEYLEKDMDHEDRIYECTEKLRTVSMDNSIIINI